MSSSKKERGRQTVANNQNEENELINNLRSKLITKREQNVSTHSQNLLDSVVVLKESKRENVKFDNEPRKIKVMGVSPKRISVSETSNETHQHLGKSFQTIEIRKRSKIIRDEENASNIEVSARDPMSSKEDLNNENEDLNEQNVEDEEQSMEYRNNLMILKIMKETAEREYEAISRRLAKTKVRMNEIVSELNEINYKKKDHLEKELQHLIKRSEIEKYKLRQYKKLNEKKNPSLSSSLSDNLDKIETVKRSQSTDSAKINSEKTYSKASLKLRTLSKSSIENCDFSSTENLEKKGNISSKKFLKDFKNKDSYSDDEGTFKGKKIQPQNYFLYWMTNQPNDEGYGSISESLNSFCGENENKKDELKCLIRPFGRCFSDPQINKLIEEKKLINIPIDDSLVCDQFNNQNLKIDIKKEPIENTNELEILFESYYQNIINASEAKMNDYFYELNVPEANDPIEVSSGLNVSRRRESRRFNANSIENNNADFFSFINPYNYLGGVSVNNYSGVGGRSVPINPESSNVGYSDQRVPSGNSSSANNSRNNSYYQRTGTNLPNNSSYIATGTGPSMNTFGRNNNLSGSRSSSYERSISNQRSQSNEKKQRENSEERNDHHDRKNNLINFEYLEVDYIEEEFLNQIDLTKYEVFINKLTNESVLFDILNPNERQTVILPKGWLDSEELPYIAEENVDLGNLKIHQDSKTKRRYVVDPATGKRYYLVSLEKMKLKRNNLLRLNKNLKSLEKIDDSEQVIHFKYNENDKANSNFLGYVEEFELNDINLADAIIKEDPITKEVTISSKNLPTKHWVVLPKNWELEETSPYLDEEDVSEAKFEIYLDSLTNRKYIIDEKTGQRYYLIPKGATNFRKDWLNIKNSIRSSSNDNNTNHNNNKRYSSSIQPNNNNRTRDSDSNYPKRNYGPTIKPGPNSNQNPNPSNSLRDDLDTIRLANQDKYDALNNNPRFAANAARFSDRNRSSSNSERNNFLNQQPIKNDLNKPSYSGGSSSKSPNRQGNVNNQAPALKQGQKKPQNQRNATKQQQQLIKMRQEQARRIFFAQKLPNMGELWLHQLLVDEVNRKKRFNALRSRSTDNLLDDFDHTGKHWRSLTNVNDPTLKDGELDRKRLLDIQINGYDKYDKSRRNRNYLDQEDTSDGSYYSVKDKMRKNDKSKLGFGGNHPGFVRGILTEQFQDYYEYVPKRINRNHRALIPVPRKYLRHQFLLTPRYLKDSWTDAVSQSWKLKPRIILINDDERIVTANKNCNVYVQFMYDNDGVLGADRAYQLMLPDRGPTSPTRPLMVTPRKLEKRLRLNPQLNPEVALREAPVFVTHPDGTSYYENLAQYLAGNFAKLSPKTARKILQFEDSKDFENYLAAKITREEAKRIADVSGERLINLDSIRSNLLNLVNDHPVGDEPMYWHKDCEYDPLRNLNELQQQHELNTDLNATTEYEVGGQKIKSTFVGYTPTGDIEKINYQELPNSVLEAMRKAANKENNKNPNINKDKAKFVRR